MRAGSGIGLLVPLAVAFLGGLCFLPALSGSFLNWDDNVNFLGNPAYRGLGLDAVRGAATDVLFGHYIPLTRLTWSANYAVSGLDPWGYHLVNLALHAANAAIFYFVARRLLAAAAADGPVGPGRDPALVVPAGVAALVFGIHPLRVEPVAWISARPDLLCALFSLLAVWAYLRAVDDRGPAAPRHIALATVAFAAALLSKGTALPLPAALILLDIYPLRRLSHLGWRQLVREKLPLLLVMAAGTAMVAYALAHGAALTRMATYGPVARLTAAIYACVVSLARFLWPGSLSPLYEMPSRISLLEPRFGGGVAVAVLLTALLIAGRRRWPGGLAAWIFSALMVAPTSAAVRQGADLAPDRYSYVAGLGFAALVGGGTLGVMGLVRRGVLSRTSAGLLAIGALVGLTALGVASWTYAQVWTDSETLWRWAVEVDPDCSVCHGKLGESALDGPQGSERVAEAEASFRRAIVLRPDLPDAYFNLASVLVIQARYVEAVEPLRSYAARAPAGASELGRQGLRYVLEARYGAAIPFLRTALEGDPGAPALRALLAEALHRRAGQLRAEGLTAESERLAAESRALRDGGRTEEPTLRTLTPKQNPL